MNEQIERVTVDNGVERDVNEATDYHCPDCSTEGVQVWHIDPDKE